MLTKNDLELIRGVVHEEVILSEGRMKVYVNKQVIQSEGRMKVYVDERVDFLRDFVDEKADFLKVYVDEKVDSLKVYIDEKVTFLREEAGKDVEAILHVVEKTTTPLDERVKILEEIHEEELRIPQKQ